MRKTIRCFRNAATAQRRRAAILTLFVLLLPVLIILLGFCIDAAYMQLVRTEMRSGVDNAARAAANELGESESYSAARRDGRIVSRNFFVAGKRMRLRSSDFEFGRSTKSDSGKFEFVAGATPPNSVRVSVNRDAQSPDGAVELFFGRWIGREGFSPSATAIATVQNVDICLVLDRSTSMKLSLNSPAGGLSIYDWRFCSPAQSGTRWEALAESVDAFTEVLGENAVEEEVAVVTYGSDLWTVLPGWCGREPVATVDLDLTANLEQVSSEIARRSNAVWNGNTHIADGIELGREHLVTRGRRFTERVLLVMTDGHPTSGDAVAAARNAAADGIVVHTITFGSSANQSLMQSVALAGGGSHKHASDADELEAVFREFAAMATTLVE